MQSLQRNIKFQILSYKKDDQKRDKKIHTMLVFIDDLKNTWMKKYYTNKFITPFANDIDKSKFITTCPQSTNGKYGKKKKFFLRYKNMGGKK